MHLFLGSHAYAFGRPSLVLSFALAIYVLQSSEEELARYGFPSSFLFPIEVHMTWSFTSILSIGEKQSLVYSDLAIASSF